METRAAFLRWLSKKLYLTTVGTYTTIGLFMILPIFFSQFFSASPFVASFAAFFVVAFLSAFYENVIINEVPVRSISLPKMFFLVLITAGILSVVSYYLKPVIGYFSIPVAVFIALRVVAKVKSILWPTLDRQGFFIELPAKLELNKFGMYVFYSFLVGIAYTAYNKYGVDFAYAFTTAFFVGMILEEMYTFIKVYEQKLTARPLLTVIIWSAFCAVASTAIVIVMMKQWGYGGQSATIASVVLMKLIQPLGTRKFILG